MHPVVFRFPIKTHDPLGRMDTFDLSDQTRMELLVSGFVDTSAVREDGAFQPVEGWLDVKRNAENHISAVEWWDYGTAPFSAGGTLELKWLPETIQAFALTGSNMEGTIDMDELPKGIRTLSLQRNRLHGSLDMRCLPSGMIRLQVHTNRLYGSLDLSALPQYLDELQLEENVFCGTVVIGLLPEKIFVFLRGNPIEGFCDANGRPHMDHRIRAF